MGGEGTDERSLALVWSHFLTKLRPAGCWSGSGSVRRHAYHFSESGRDDIFCSPTPTYSCLHFCRGLTFTLSHVFQHNAAPGKCTRMVPSSTAPQSNSCSKSNYVMCSHFGIIIYGSAHVSAPSACVRSIYFISIWVRIRISAEACSDWWKNRHTWNVCLVCVCVCAGGSGRGGVPPGTEQL